MLHRAICHCGAVTEPPPPIKHRVSISTHTLTSFPQALSHHQQEQLIHMVTLTDHLNLSVRSGGGGGTQAHTKGERWRAT